MALNKVVQFRISDVDYLKYTEKVKESGYTPSEFFRNAVMNNQTKVIQKEDSIKLIYHHNKMGNNINQIAYGINKALLTGAISNSVFTKVLSELNLIKQQQRNIIDLILYAKGIE